MTLYIDTTGFPTTVEINALEIVAGDGGLGDIPVSGDPTVVQVTYVPTQSGFGETLIQTLVNLSNTVVVTGVSSGFLVDGTPISNYAGYTFCDGSILRVIYDTTQCGGTQYYVFDSGGNQIGFPTFVLLGHELSHCVHIANGDHSCPPLSAAGVAAAEFLAETDENSLRSQNGFALRDPNNHGGGCGFSGSTPSSPSVSCFIATAASGSPRSREVQAFIRLRDVFLRDTAVGSAFFDSLFREYYQFSPTVASEMNRSPLARDLIAAIAVDPLLDFYDWVQARTIRAGRDRDLIPALAAARGAAMRRLADTPARALQPEVLADYVTAVRRAVIGQRPSSGGGSRSTVIADVSSVAEMVAETMRARLPGSTYVDWALMRPIEIYWQTIALADSRGGPVAAEWLDRQLDAWLLDLPVPEAFVSLSRSEAAQELHDLGELLFVDNHSRQLMGQRLLALFEGKVSYELADILAAAGFISPSRPARGVRHA